MFSSCAQQIQQYRDLLTDLLPPNCTVLDQGVAAFPVGSYGDQGVEMQCSNSTAITKVDCPKPLKPYPNPRCFIECPRIFTSVGEFDAMRYISLILGLISFLVEIFLIPAYALFPGARRWPARLLLYYFIANFIGVIGIQLSWKGESMWCASGQ